MGGWWVVGWSNLILDPTLALIRSQLGFRIQVRAECGKNCDSLIQYYHVRTQVNKVYDIIAITMYVTIVTKIIIN